MAKPLNEERATFGLLLVSSPSLQVVSFFGDALGDNPGETNSLIAT